MGKIINNKVLLFIVAILLLANIAMLTYFVWRKDPVSNKVESIKQRSPMMVFLESQVGFNEQQIVEFQKLRQEHKKRLRPLFEDIRQTKIRFYQLLNDPQASDSILEQNAAAIGVKQKALDLQAFQNFREIRALCTQEQKPLYDSLVPSIINKMWFSPRKTNGHDKEKSQK